MATATLKIFDYIADLDCFVVNQKYRHIAEELGLSEWTPVVWIGRLFMLDNDFGEHWFDNWHLREQLWPEAEKRGLAYEELLIIDPDRFKNDVDGPCHSPTLRKQFWTEVLKSLELSYELLFAEARLFNARHREYLPERFDIPDLEERITRLRKEYCRREN